MNRSQQILRLALLGAALLASACPGVGSSNPPSRCDPTCPVSPATDSGSATGDDAGDTTKAESAIACSWPARFDRGDAAPPGACHAKRHLLMCTQSGNGIELCTSNTLQCAPEDAGTEPCDEQCKPNEYAIYCGAIGGDSAGNADPAAKCHDPKYTPAGVYFMCCPCE